jgi:hypothetical protein
MVMLDKDLDRNYDESAAAAPVALAGGDGTTVRGVIRATIAPYLTAINASTPPTRAQFATAVALCGIVRIVDAIQSNGSIPAGKKRNLNGPAVQAFLDAVTNQDATGG